MKNNIVLIGMPSSGKSTVGEPLSKELNMKFIDTDKIIFDREKRPLRDIVNSDGLKTFLEIQEKTIMDICVSNTVISTGGSVVYNSGAMEYLKDDGLVIFLKSDFEEIEKRVTKDRRFARNEDQTLIDLYNERMPLYEKYADITIYSTGKSVETLVDEIKKASIGKICVLEN